MWFRTDGYGMTDEVVEQVEQAVPSAPSIQVGECSTWLNLNTGARLLHVRFGEYHAPRSRHGVFYRSPVGELFDISFPMIQLFESELNFLPRGSEVDRQINVYRWRQADHKIETALRLREDEFDEEWPGSNIPRQHDPTS